MKEYRSFQLDLDTRDDKQRTVAASLSSEEPVLRVYGREVLEHTAEAVDLSREPFPLIVSHDNSDTPVGIVENVRIVGRKLRGLLRFGKGNIASEKWKDVKDGILRNLSIGYQILEGHSDGEFYRATRWQLAEVSLVAVPADPTVGIGRSEDFMEQQHEDKRRPRAIKREARQEAIEELKEIRALGKVHGFEAEADRAIDNDWPLERFREFVMDKLTEQNLKPIETPGSVVLGLNDRQAQSFSFVRFYNALANPQDQNAQRNAGFELEVCRAYADRIGSRGEGFRIPPEALVGRDLTVGTDAGGGYTVGTDMRPQDFIDALRNKMVCVQAGATLLSGLVGDIAIPRLSLAGLAKTLKGTVSVFHAGDADSKRVF
ncbi:hypothetical protein D3OALGA1CA_5710 [Olavius algarvensis associated proteobacterium Delta 3]|nr:hypothetical protein D3OALGA1CA_5710 [Olavius algarvensis associated proteobacterium Delta 3]